MTIYERALILDNDIRKQCKWPSSAFVGVNWPEPENDLERDVMEFVQAQCPSGVTITVQHAADLIIEYLKISQTHQETG